MVKNIGVLGLGKSGIAAANLSVKLGYNVFASDSKKREIKGLNRKVSTEFGAHSDRILASDIIIKSPGICRDIPILKKACQHKIMVTSELAFALLNSKYKKIIAVTGTNGKTTTTDLISKIVKAAHKNSIVSGNIGFPLAGMALKTTKNTYITMELSSYQLEDTPKFKPSISALLNIAPDHLDHHKTMKAYIKAKGNISINQTCDDFAVINYDDKLCAKTAKKTKAKIIFFSKRPLKNGVFYDKGKIVIIMGKKHIEINPKINIVGMHNVENILAATAATYAAGIAPLVIEKVISKYKGVKHRIEFIKTLNGVDYYNDSKSTNIDSLRVALESFDGNILLIMGGRDKGCSYIPLRQLVRQKVKAVFLIGEASSQIKKDLKNTSIFFDTCTIENALNCAFKTAKKGDIVLLSPACSSFDQFRDFEERGTVFKQLVNKL
jgi:UDP-N-acetylmuramoylalanine--D-glutamate ligase